MVTQLTKAAKMRRDYEFLPPRNDQGPENGDPLSVRGMDCSGSVRGDQQGMLRDRRPHTIVYL